MLDAWMLTNWRKILTAFPEVLLSHSSLLPITLRGFLGGFLLTPLDVWVHPATQIKLLSVLV